MDKQPLELRRFDSLFAPPVAGWVADGELLWLAPGTTPPLTAAKVVGWTKPTDRPLLLFRENEGLPCGYAELNPMRGSFSAVWLGHVVIDPQLRGRGLGAAFTRRLIEEAFADPVVERIVLIVFPDNQAAIRCYRSTGFAQTGRERHQFISGGPVHTMLRLELPRGLAACCADDAGAQ
jgi:ribosomal protein S18 acetylase RimI-like enzyme